MILRIKNLSNDFVSSLIQLSSGRIHSEALDNFISLVEKEISQHYFTPTSESNLLRIIKSRYDFTFFIEECVKYPHRVEILVTISSNSNYLSDILVISPEYFYQLIDSSYLNNKLNEKNFNREVEERIGSHELLETKVHTLNSFKRREILRIGFKDIYHQAELSEVIDELTIVAKTLTDNLFSSCHKFILNKYKIKRINRSYCIVSLGKLGGNELNYSSDVDIIIFYNKEEKIGKKYYSEILAETIQLFLDKCTSSEAGSLYRIDLRLRPDGKSSAVCRSLREYLDYYESRGNDWERQMLIKAGYLGGSKKLFSEFIQYIDKFIFPSAHFVSPLEQMNKLKKIIERDTEEANIKLIPGGIRDIEFIVQALQLLNGGKNKSLKTSNTLSALQKLKQSDLLSTEETETLQRSYIIYRKVEHFLQLMNNSQTHIIPESGELAEKLSHYLGYKKLEEFKNDIKEFREKVKSIYDSIVGKESVSGKKQKSLQVKFVNPQKALNNISFLREGKGITVRRKFDRESIEAFSKIEESLFDKLNLTDDPDLCLTNFIRVIKQADFPSIWYNEFRDESFFKIFLKLCEYSQYTVDLFAEDKILREKFLSRDFLNKVDEKEIVFTPIKELLFKISVQLTLTLIDANRASIIISESIIKRIRRNADEFSNKKKWKNDFFIVVLGSTGTKTMSFMSDVDLIFAVNNSSKYEKIQKDFQDLLGILKKGLFPFKVDCRLRPEGESSQLVWDLGKYKVYYSNRARIWELQSFLKARLVCGKEKLFDELSDSFITRLSNLSVEEIYKGISEIRAKSPPTFPAEMNLIDLKKNPGSLNDIEYMVHYILLSEEKLSKKILGNSIPLILKEFAGAKKNKKVLTELADNYIFLKKLEIFNQVAFNSISSKIADDDKRFAKLAKLLEISEGNILKRKIKSVFKSNRDYFSEIVSKK